MNAVDGEDEIWPKRRYPILGTILILGDFPATMNKQFESCSLFALPLAGFTLCHVTHQTVVIGAVME